jgi:hypothetical protein
MGCKSLGRQGECNALRYYNLFTNVPAGEGTFLLLKVVKKHGICNVKMLLMHVFFEILKQRAVSSDQESLMQILNHAEMELEAGYWNLLGWWKGATRSDENTLTNPKVHVVSATKQTGVQKWHANSASPSPSNFSRRSQSPAISVESSVEQDDNDETNDDRTQVCWNATWL